MSAQAGFAHKTPEEGREWTTDLTYNRSFRDSRTGFNTSTYGSGGIPITGGARAQTSTGSTEGDQFTWQLDVQDPRSERTKFDYGLRSNVRIERSILDVIVGTDTSDAQADPDLSNDYRSTDVVNAAYFNWTHKLNANWGVQAGLRAGMGEEEERQSCLDLGLVGGKLGQQPRQKDRLGTEIAAGLRALGIASGEDQVDRGEDGIQPVGQVLGPWENEWRARRHPGGPRPPHGPHPPRPHPSRSPPPPPPPRPPRPPGRLIHPPLQLRPRLRNLRQQPLILRQ